MIEIKVTGSKDTMEVFASADIKGRDKGVNQMFAVLTALDRMDSEVLCDSFEMFLKYKMQEKNNDDESEG